METAFFAANQGPIPADVPAPSSPRAPAVKSKTEVGVGEGGSRSVYFLIDECCNWNWKLGAKSPFLLYSDAHTHTVSC